MPRRIHCGFRRGLSLILFTMVIPTTCSVKIGFQRHAFFFSKNHHRGAGGTKPTTMKKVTIFKSAILALLACVGIVACDKGADVVPDEPETYTVQLGWAGEILDVSYEPMATRAATNDLYGIQVYSKAKSASSSTDWAPYAYGLFDDPGNITITLQSSHKYKFVATMVKDGKNRVCKDKNDEEYYNPFFAKLDNKFYYDATVEKSSLSRGGTDLIEGNSDKYYRRPNIERFYGELSDYIPGGNSNAKIDMKRTSFGAKFVVGGKLAVDGKLEIQLEDAPKMELALTAGADEISDIFTFYMVEDAWAENDYTDDVNVAFKWIRADGTESPMGTHKITFKRNTTTVVEFNIDKDGNDEGVDLDIPNSETGAMANGAEVTINDGEMQ